MKVTDLMRKNVYTTLPEVSLHEAAEKMLRKDVGALPVVDEQGELLGMITDRDICMCGLIEGRTLKDLPVSLAMSTPVFACTEEDTLADVHKAMQTHQVYRLPIVDEAKVLLGIVGLSDLVRATTGKKRGATTTALIRTLTLVSEPRELAELEAAARPADEEKLK